MSSGTQFDVDTETRALFAQNQFQLARHSLLTAWRTTHHETFATHHTGELSYGYAFTPAVRTYVSYATGFRAPDQRMRFEQLMLESVIGRRGAKVNKSPFRQLMLNRAQVLVDQLWEQVDRPGAPVPFRELDAGERALLESFPDTEFVSREWVERWLDPNMIRRPKALLDPDDPNSWTAYGLKSRADMEGLIEEMRTNGFRNTGLIIMDYDPVTGLPSSPRATTPTGGGQDVGHRRGAHRHPNPRLRASR